MSSLLEGVEYHPIGTLDVSVGLWMGDGNIPDVNPAVLAIFPKLVVVEVGPQVCDDAMGLSVEVYEFVQEVEYLVGLWVGDRLDFDSLGELVDSHQDSVESFWRLRERPNHVEPQVGERPSWWYSD
jgi:hypothetical protein